MAFYYYYQQHHTPFDSFSLGTMASGLTPSLTPLILLSPQLQQQMTLPLVTPILPSVTATLPMTTTPASIEYNQQQQLSTPKLSPFLRHCEETGLFQELRNIGAISSGDTTSITVPVTTTSTLVSSTSTELPINSSLFGLSSSTILTHMPNPFDETFKQAVLQQQKCNSKLSENIFSDNNYTNGDLNTPFISTTTIVNTSNNHNNSTLTMATLPIDTITTAVVAAPITVESMMSNASTLSQPQQENLFMTTPATKSTNGSVFVMMMEQQQQQHNSIVSLQPQNQHHHTNEQHQHLIAPTTTNITNETDKTTITFHNQDISTSKSVKGKNNKANRVENETTLIKQTLKQNLLVKRQMQERQRSSFALETHLNSGQKQLHDLDIQVLMTDDTIKNKKNSDDHGQENDNDQKRLQQKLKQEMLERNRSAAKRCRMKRKQRWELLSQENRRLKIENSRLRDILAKVINNGCGGLQTTVRPIQQGQEQSHQSKNQKNCIKDKNV